VANSVPPVAAEYSLRVVEAALESLVNVTVKLVVDPEVPATVGAFAWLSVNLGVTLDDVPAVEFPDALIATTENVYAVPFVKPVNVQEVLAVFVHDAGAVTAGEEVTVYPVIALPPLDPGAVQLICEEALATVPETDVGGPGGAAAVTLLDALEAAEFPAAFVATTV